MDFRIRPKSDYLQKASWQQLHVLTNHWRSDMQFFKDEIHFFLDLVEKKLVWLEHDGNINLLKAITNKLRQVQTESHQLEVKLGRHLRQLEELYENPFAHDEHAFREEHSKLEDHLTEFVKTFRGLKREVFAMVEQVTESEQEG